MNMFRPLCLVCALIILLSNIATSAEPVRVSPIRSFDVKSSLPQDNQPGIVMIEDFLAHTTGLYFLVAYNEDPSDRVISDHSRKSVLHTDTTGRVKKLIALPWDEQGSRTRSFHGLAVDDIGNCMVLQSLRLERKWKMELVVYNSYGALVASIPASDQNSTDGPVAAFCAKSKDIFYFTGKQYLGHLPAPVTDTKLGSRTKLSGLGILEFSLKMVPLPGENLAILDGVLCKLHIVSSSASIVKSISLDQIPEVKLGSESYEPDTRGQAIILPNIVSTKHGDIYVDVTGHDVRGGAVILHLDSTGKLLQSLRCELSRLGEGHEGHPDGYLGYRYVSVADTQLMLCSPDGIVAVYPR